MLGLKVFKIHPDAKFELKRGDDAGYDLYCHTRVDLPPAITIKDRAPMVAQQERPDTPGENWPPDDGVARMYTVPGTRALFTKEEAIRANWGSKMYPKIEALDLKPTFKVVKIPTGLAFEIPAGYYGQVLDKSSVGILGIKSYAGCIDPSYRGELHVCLANHTDTIISFPAGAKIAQIVFLQYSSFDIEWVDSLEALSSTARGEGGFGSTGAS